MTTLMLHCLAVAKSKAQRLGDHLAKRGIMFIMTEPEGGSDTIDFKFNTSGDTSIANSILRQIFREDSTKGEAIEGIKEKLAPTEALFFINETQMVQLERLVFEISGKENDSRCAALTCLARELRRNKVSFDLI